MSPRVKKILPTAAATAPPCTSRSPRPAVSPVSQPTRAPAAGRLTAASRAWAGGRPTAELAARALAAAVAACGSSACAPTARATPAISATMRLLCVILIGIGNATGRATATRRRFAFPPSRGAWNNGGVNSTPAAPAPRDVVILGSTGSIGTQALDIVRRNPGRFRVVGLAAGGGNPGLLARQAAEFGVDVVAVADSAAVASVRGRAKSRI